MSRPITGERRRAIVDALKARDGGECWLCFRVIRKGKETLEHLLAQSLGGTYALENLVLCCGGCNRQLSNRPVADKWKMRRKREQKVLEARKAQAARDRRKSLAATRMIDAK
jgi:5-methylcytosine-specific restriction endonuclease McrA